jgi:hypothetical protein
MRKNKASQICKLVDLLADMSPCDRKTIIPYLNEEGCKSIYECVNNALYNKDIPAEKKRLIRKYLKNDVGCYRSLLKTNLHAKTKQKKLCQVGGRGLGLILEAVLPILTDIARNKKDDDDEDEERVRADDDDTG